MSLQFMHSQQSRSPPSPLVRFVSFLTGNPEYAIGPNGAIRDVIAVRKLFRQLHQFVTGSGWPARFRSCHGDQGCLSNYKHEQNQSVVSMVTYSCNAGWGWDRWRVELRIQPFEGAGSAMDVSSSFNARSALCVGDPDAFATEMIKMINDREFRYICKAYDRRLWLRW